MKVVGVPIRAAPHRGFLAVGSRTARAWLSCQRPCRSENAMPTPPPGAVGRAGTGGGNPSNTRCNPDWRDLSHTLATGEEPLLVTDARHLIRTGDAPARESSSRCALSYGLVGICSFSTWLDDRLSRRTVGPTATSDRAAHAAGLGLWGTSRTRYFQPFVASPNHSCENGFSPADVPGSGSS